MRLLLDTNSFLWFIKGSKRLSIKAKQAIEDIQTDKLLSVVSLWEMAIKYSLGKLKLRKPYEEVIPDQLLVNGIQLLHIEPSHLIELSKLPFHHRDPFDRLLVAQSKIENLPVISPDNAFDLYQIERIW